MLSNDDLLSIGEYRLSATDVADILWLASFCATSVSPSPLIDEDIDIVEETYPTVTDDSGEGYFDEEIDSTQEPFETPSFSDVSVEVQIPQESEPTAPVYTGDHLHLKEGTADGWGSMGFKIPYAPAIPEKAAIIRSLRPLQRRIPSISQFALNESKTAEQIATALTGRGPWLPVSDPMSERWLDLVILVDGAPSMALWRQTVEEFVALLANVGLFRNVQRWTLAVVETDGAVNDERKTELHLYPGGPTASSAYTRRVATELLDPKQRRLFLVISDCNSIVWDSGAMHQLLHPLAKNNLVSLIQVLPEELWGTTALKLAEETRLTSRQPLSSNAELIIGQERPSINNPLPVVSLEPDALRLWAGFLVGRESRSVPGYYLPTFEDAAIDVDQTLLDLGIGLQVVEGNTAINVADLYNRFRENTPQRARLLAIYFAAVPLTLPVMRLVQTAMLPETTHADFVRLFYSGLIRRKSSHTLDNLENDTIYDFVGGDAMREFLLTKLPRYSAEEIVDLVIAELSRYVQQHIDQLTGFDAIIALRNMQGTLHVDATARHFMEVTTKVLHHLGGRYTILADNLVHHVLPAPLAKGLSTDTSIVNDANIRSLRDSQLDVDEMVQKQGDHQDVRVEQNTLDVEPRQRDSEGSANQDGTFVNDISFVSQPDESNRKYYYSDREQMKWKHWNATPALIVGLGGAGVRALTHLKKNLITLNNGVLPIEVRLLAFDTVTKSDFAVGGDSQVVGDVRLEARSGEYIHIGGNIRPYMKEVAIGRQPHVESWLQASYYLDTLQDAQFFLEKGAGMLRQFGRVGLFDDLRTPGMSKIYNSLRAAIQHIQTNTNAPTIEVALVFSTAGGTGAGMFVDIAHLVRQMARPTNIRLRGFLLLPEAFQKIPSGITNDMKARSYAALRETQRFMVNSDWSRGYPMYYHSSEGHTNATDVLRGHIQSKLFDHMYLIDGRRPQNNLNQYLLDMGVAPSIADMLTVILDVEGGQSFTEHENNMNIVAQTRGESGLQKTAICGALGTFTIVLPINHIVDKFSHQLALATLEKWLLPANKVDGVPDAVLTDRNQDIGVGKQGRDDSLTFLRLTQVVDAYDPQGKRQVSNTRLMPEIARVAQRYSPDNPSVVSELAGRPLPGWLELFVPPGDSPEVEEIRRQVNAIIALSLENVVPTSNKVQGEKPVDALRRIEDQVRTFKTRHLGGENFDGRRDGGEYRQSLERLAAIHLYRFQMMLNYHSRNVLNGEPQSDSVWAKSGRLGYLFDLFWGLEKAFTSFLSVMIQVREFRDLRSIRLDMFAKAQDAMGNMKQKAASWIPGQAVGAQRDYIRAEQRVVDLSRQELLEDVIRETTYALLEYCRGASQTVRDWLQTLIVGPNSLYAELLQGQRQLEANRQAEKELKVREIIDDRAYEAELYHRYTREGQVVADMLRDLTWSIEMDDQGATRRFELRLTCQISGESAILTRERRQDNRLLFLRRAGQTFTELKQAETCLKYLKRMWCGENNSNPGNLGTYLATRAGLMLSFDRSTVAVPASYLLIKYGDEGDDESFLDEVLKAVTNQTQTRSNFVDKVKSVDPYKCTLVYTMEMIPLRAITSYKESEGDYKSFRSTQKGGGRRILHLFPAEVNAVVFEERLGELNENLRLLDDKVVIQLENMKRCRLFASCLVYSLIDKVNSQESSGEILNCYALILPQDDGDPYNPLPPVKIWLTSPKTGNPDLLKALGQFNYEGHDVRAEVRDLSDPIRTINYDRVRRVLQDARQRQGEELGEVPGQLSPIEQKALEGLAPDSSDARMLRSLLGQRYWIRKQQAGLLMPLRNASDPAQKDLGTVLWLMLDDEVRRLNVNVEQKFRNYAASSENIE